MNPSAHDWIDSLVVAVNHLFNWLTMPSYSVRIDSTIIDLIKIYGFIRLSFFISIKYHIQVFYRKIFQQLVQLNLFFANCCTCLKK